MKIGRFALGASLVFFLAFLNMQCASATTANTLRISPIRSDVVIEPGKSAIVKATITNLIDTPVTVRPVVNDFVAGDTGGTPALILDEKAYAPVHSLKRFVSELSVFTLEGKESVTVDVRITVPVTAKAGGYFGAVRFAPETPNGGGQVNVSASAASLILLTVPGDFIENMSISGFSVSQKGNTGTFFFTPDSLTLSAAFKNEGTVQLAPTGNVFIQKGSDVVYEAPFNSVNPKDMVLPGSVRKWDVPLDNIDSIGRYTVTATFSYGKKNQTIEVSESFWVVPIYVIVGAFVAVALVVGGGIAVVAKARKGRRGRRRHRR